MQSFSSLSEAVRFLASVIDRSDYVALAAACHEELPPEWVLERLRERHQETPLPELYQGWEFPPDAQSFKLGGHDQELGHLHLDFIKSPAGWELHQIWMCR